LLLPICLSGGNDSYDFVLLPIAVTYDQDPDGGTEAQKNESFLFLGMLWIRQDPRILIEKGTPRLLE